MPDYTNKIIYLGIDVHKSTYSITAICDDQIVKRDKIVALPTTLVDYCRRHFKGAIIKSAYESGFSGFYLHRFLISQNIENIVVHAASIEVSSRDRVKTDKRDSLKIASHLSKKQLRPIHVPSVEREDRRNLTRLRESLVRQRTRTACQLKSLLNYYGLLPPDQKTRISEKWLKSLEKLDVTKNLKYSITVYLTSLKYFNAQLKRLENEIRKDSASDEFLKRIYCSFPGVGKSSAVILINELGDTLQFSNEEKLFSHVGLTPSEYSSGENTRKGHITRQGKALIRRILIQVAWKAIKRDPQLANKFEKIKVRAGKKRAIVAIARMILSRIRSCIKSKRPYLVEVKKGAISTEVSQKVV